MSNKSSHETLCTRVSAAATVPTCLPKIQSRFAGVSGFRFGTCCLCGSQWSELLASEILTPPAAILTAIWISWVALLSLYVICTPTAGSPKKGWGIQDDGHDVRDNGNVGGGDYDDHYINHFL